MMMFVFYPYSECSNGDQMLIEITPYNSMAAPEGTAIYRKEGEMMLHRCQVV